MDTRTQLSPTLQRVHELRAEGKSLRKMVDILQSEGVPLPPGRYKKWNHMGVQACLQQLEALTSPPRPSITALPAVVDPPPNPARLDVKIQGPWLESDSLLWEFLIHQAWDHLTEKTEHTLPLEDILEGPRLTPPPRDREHLWATLDRLTASRVRLESLHNHETLSISTPLLSAALTARTLSFQFPAALIKLVKIPREYGRLQELFRAKQ